MSSLRNITLDEYSRTRAWWVRVQRGDTTHSKLFSFAKHGGKVAALVMDMNSRLLIPGAPQRTNHRGKKVSVGFAAGNVQIVDTPKDELSLRPEDIMDIWGRLDEILQHADGL